MNTTNAYPFGILLCGETAIRAATEAERDASKTGDGTIFLDMLTYIDGDSSGRTIVRPVPCYVVPYVGSYGQDYQLSMASDADRASVMNVAETTRRAELHAILSR